MYLAFFDTGNVSRETSMISILNWYLLLDIRLFLSTFSRCPFFRLFFALYLPFFRVFTTYLNPHLTTFHHTLPNPPFFRHFSPLSTLLFCPFSTQFYTIHFSNFYPIRHFTLSLHYATLHYIIQLIPLIYSTSFDYMLLYTTLYYIYIQLNTNTTNIY